MEDINSIINNQIEDHRKILEKVLGIQKEIFLAAQVVVDTLKSKQKILLFGNGGSAADAQHIAAEFVGRFKTERQSLPAIALTTDTSALTAIANDYDYDQIFKRQVSGLAQKGDLLIGISTSGNSSNVVNGLKMGKGLGCRTIGFSGAKLGKMDEFCEVNLKIPSQDTARIQEMHILIAHILCEVVDQAFLD